MSRRKRPEIDPTRVTESQGPMSVPNDVHFVAGGYEVNQWSSQPADAKEHRPEHLVVATPIFLNGKRFVSLLRLKSRRAAMEMITILEKNMDDIWNEDGTLVGPRDDNGKPKTSGEAIAKPDENGVRIISPSQIELQCFADHIRVQFDLEDQTVALALPDQGTTLGLCERLFEGSMMLWGEPDDEADENKRSEVLN